MTKLEKRIPKPRNYYTQKMWWNEEAYAEGMGGLLGVRVLQAVDDGDLFDTKHINKKAEKILSEIPKEEIPDMEKLLSEIIKLSNYCNAWADEDRYVETDDNNRRIAVNLEDIEYSKYKKLNGEWGEVWLDGYQRCIHDVYQRIQAVKLLAHIVELAKK